MPKKGHKSAWDWTGDGLCKQKLQDSADGWIFDSEYIGGYRILERQLGSQIAQEMIAERLYQNGLPPGRAKAWKVHP